MATTRQGSPQFPTSADSVQPSTRKEMDAAVQVLQEQKNAWVTVSTHARIALIDELLQDFAAIAERWVAACCEAKGIAQTTFVGEEWGTGPYTLLKQLRQVRQSLVDIQTRRAPRIAGPVTTRADGQVVAQVFPQTPYDRLFFTGLTAEVWMEPGVTAEGLAQTQAVNYQEQHAGKVALVLGAGNVSSIAPLDILYKLFVEDQVVVLKMNPVNAYLGPLLQASFKALIEPGFLRITYGGATEGAYLCTHEGVEEIHITGSDKTFDTIVRGRNARRRTGRCCTSA